MLPVMIYHNPPSIVLAQAEVITLLDLNVPKWKEVVVARKMGRSIGAGDLATINIPVDSKDAGAIQGWRDRIAQARV